jgi:hypothetical protein
MNTALPHSIFFQLKEDHFSMVYTGDFDDELTSTLMKINEESMTEALQFKKKISFLITECFQNIIRHAEKPDILNSTNNKPKMFMIRNIGSIFHIASSNLVDNRKKDELAKKLKSINTLKKEELREVYLDALTNNEYGEKGGGGLGLIEMARKSNHPLQFDFEFVNFYFSNFFMQISIEDRNDNEPAEEIKTPGTTLKIKEVMKLYNELLQENVILLRKGDFSRQTILPLLNLVENCIPGQKQLPALNKKIFYLLIEMLQNISKHGSNFNGLHEGIFLVTYKNKAYTIHSGNYVDAGNVEGLKNHLNTLAKMDENALSEAYKSNLLNKEPDNSSNAGIGLIEMFRYGKGNVKYSFTPVSDAVTFFSLSVTV